MQVYLIESFRNGNLCNGKVPIRKPIHNSTSNIIVGRSVDGLKAIFH